MAKGKDDSGINWKGKQEKYIYQFFTFAVILYWKKSIWPAPAEKCNFPIPSF